MSRAIPKLFFVVFLPQVFMSVGLARYGCHVGDNLAPETARFSRRNRLFGGLLS